MAKIKTKKPPLIQKKKHRSMTIPNYSEGKAQYFLEDGTYLGSNNSREGVFLVEKSWKSADGLQNVFNIKDLKILRDNNKIAFTPKQFFELAGTVMVEMDKNKFTAGEGAKIYSVIENRAALSHKTVYEQQSIGGIYGYSHRAELFDEAYWKNGKGQAAIAGVMKAMLDPNDLSGGAYWWQGRDFKISTMNAYKLYYNVGFDFTNDKHDIWGMKDHEGKTKGMPYKYESTDAEGGTIFMKKTETWKLKNNNKVYP